MVNITCSTFYWPERTQVPWGRGVVELCAGEGEEPRMVPPTCTS